MLANTTVYSFLDINRGLAEGYRLITQALQLAATDGAKAKEARQAAASHLKAVVNRPHFSDFANHALNIYQDEVGELAAPDRFERRHISKEIDWNECTVANANGTDCLLELARLHPNALEQRLAIQALREELLSCCKEVDGLSKSEVDSLMTVIEMCNEIHNLNSAQLKKVIDKFVHKLEAQRAEKSAH